MKEAAEHVTEVLSEPAITASVTGGIFWELAEEDSDFPLVTFSISDSGPATKNSFSQYQVKLRVFAERLSQAATITNTIRASVKAGSNSWRDRGASSGYRDPEGKEAFIEITYEFKLLI